MYLTNLYLERFGERSHLRVDGLAEGLNVVFAPPASGKTTLIQFLQTLFGGFDFSLRDRYATRGWGGSISVQVDRASYAISRYDQGGRDERLSVERSDQATIERPQVQRLLSDLNHALLRHAVVVDFNRRPELKELLREISACGFLPTVDTRSNDKKQVDDAGLAEAEQHIALLRQEIAKLERTLAELGQRRKELEAQLKSVQSSSEDAQNSDLQQIERQLRRWKRTLRDLVQHRQEAAEKYAAQDFGKPTQSLLNPCRLAASLEETCSHLQGTLNRLDLNDNQNGSVQHGRQQLSSGLGKLRQHAREVTQVLQHEHTRQIARDALLERDQFARTESELRQAIRWLLSRRKKLLRQRQVESHATKNAMKNGSASFVYQPSAKASLVKELKSVTHEISRLAEVRLKWLAEIDEWQLDIADRRCAAGQTMESWTPMLTDATEYLRRLTGNDGLSVHISEQFDAWIENRSGERTAYEQLDRSMRDQLYLSFCLAVAAANQRWGRQIPVVLNGVFTHFPAQNIRHTLEFLSAFSRGHQLICLTRHEHVVSVARLMNIPVRHLTLAEVRDSRASNQELAWNSAAAPPTILEWNRPAAFSARSVETATDQRSHRPSHAARRATTDLVNAANTLEGGTDFASSPLANPVDHQTDSDRLYCLGEHDPIEKTPSLDPTNAQRLRKIGLLRVGDLLRVPTADVAHDLRHTGVSIDMVDSWRAQARLMCNVPGLRTYDARILVACGIREPEQLAQLQPGLLRARVKEFATSAEGQAVLMSGTEFELARVTDWINSAGEVAKPAVSTRVKNRVEHEPLDSGTKEPRQDRHRSRRKSSKRSGKLPPADAA